jgi:glycosyltransferase involved in cell wall biosynthesis
MYQLAKKHKNIHLIEFIDNAASYLKAFDIFVLPSLKEGLPYTILEAMAAGIPIIATRVGGIPEMLKDCGYLIPTKNPDLIGGKILEFINNPGLTQEMVDKAKEKLENEFSLEAMLYQTKRIYQ